MNTTPEPSEPFSETEQVTEVESLRAINHHLRVAMDQIDEAVLTRMSEKLTMFSRNVWDPARQNRPERSENITIDRFTMKPKEGSERISTAAAEKRSWIGSS